MVTKPDLIYLLVCNIFVFSVFITTDIVQLDQNVCIVEYFYLHRLVSLAHIVKACVVVLFREPTKTQISLQSVDKEYCT